MAEQKEKKIKVEEASKSECTQAITTFLDKTTIHSILRPQRIQVLNKDQTIESAVELLAKNHILSAPVVDGAKKLCVNILDMLDILVHILALVPEEVGENKENDKKKRVSAIDESKFVPEDLQKLKVAGKEMGSVTVGQVCGSSALNPLIRLNPNAALRDAVEFFTLGAHRIPIVNSEGEPIGVFSQSSIIQWVAENFHKPEFRYLSQKSLQQLGMAPRKLFTVLQTDTVLSALKELYLHSCTSVAVVEEGGRLIGTFSASDIKHIFPNKLDLVLKPIHAFLKEFSPSSLHCLSLNQNKSLLDAAQLMNIIHVHRVWITGPKGEPIGLVSMGDIIDLLKTTAKDEKPVGPKSDLYKLLATFSVQDALIRSRHEVKPSVITLSSKDHISDAIKLLSKNEVLSAPIVDESGVCTGTIDMLDIVVHVLSQVPKEIESPSPLRSMLDPVSVKENDLFELKIAGKHMASELVGHVSGASGLNPLVRLTPTHELVEAIDLFTCGVHRAVIVDKEEKPIGVLSQSSIIRLLVQLITKPELQSFAKKTVKELGLHEKKLVTVKDTDEVLKALQTLYANRISAVAVVDGHGQLAGNFSASDLKSMFHEKWPGFKKSVNEFLTKHHPGSLHCLVVRATTTLEDVLYCLAGSHVHRVWVVNKKFEPSGVIEMTDIMNILKESF